MAMKGKVAKMSLASTEEAAGEGVEEEKSFVPLTHVETKDVKKEWGNGAPHPKALVHGEDRYVTVGQKVQKDDGEEAAWQRRHDIEAQWAHKHQQLASRNANSAHAPTLEGGVSVPGGHVVWMPLKSLAHQPTASRASREHQVVSAREQQAMQFPAQYSKIVEYGPDGQPVATIYGPEAASRGLSSRGRGAALNGVQTLTGAVPPADGTPQKLNAGT